MPSKLTSTQYKIIVIAAAVAAVSLTVSVKYFSRAFPEASLDLRVNRDDSRPIAQNFLASRGFHVEGYRHAAIFDYDDGAKLYLERTQGLAKMNELAQGPIRLWRWSHRWFKPQQQEEFRVDVSARGEVVGFDHEIPEAAPGASLSSGAARDIGTDFLRNVMHRDLSDLEFVNSESQKRPARTDYTFTWKVKSVNLGDGSYRIQVEVDGDQVASYSEFVKIPEAWSRAYERLRGRNDAAQLVDEILFVLLSLAMAVILVQRLRDRDVPLRMAAGFGLIATVLYFLGKLNSFSLDQFGYPTTDSYSSFMTGYFRDAILSALGVGAFIFLIVASAEPLYRESFPRLPSVRRTLSWSGLRSRSFFMANVTGIALTFFFFAYQTIFYLAANKLGAWAPSDIPFSNLLNTRLPWVGVLFMGFFPAISEEMQFRAFGIPFLGKLFRSKTAGIILAAFIWGFLHSAYPNEPFFIRGVEVGVAGIIIGVVMLRFGIFATLIWHYSVDALYTAFLLLRSSNGYLRISGGLTAGIMLIPLILALVAYLRTGAFSDEADVTNERAGVVRAPGEVVVETPEAPLVYQSLTRRRVIFAGLLIAGFAALGFVPAYRFGQGIKVRFDRSFALRAATDFLTQQGVKPQTYRRLAWLDEDASPLALRYLFERLPVKQADHLYRRTTHLEAWKVRFFKPLQQEEYLAFVDPSSGAVFAYQHIVAEDEPGATLAPPAARALAEGFLQQKGYRLSDFELQNSEAAKRKAREDYTLTWQAKSGDPLNVGDAHFRVAVSIAGDQVTGVSPYIQVPEKWKRARAGSHLANAVLTGLSSLWIVALAGLVIMLFVIQVRAGKILWMRSLWVGVALAVLTALNELNDLPLLYQRYDTSVTLSNFWIEVGVGLVVVPLLLGILGWLAVGLTTSFYSDAWNMFRGIVRHRWRRDAGIVFVLSLAAGAAMTQLTTFLSGRFHAFAPIDVSIFPGQFSVAYPGISFFLHALTFTVLYVAFAGIIIYLVRSGWSGRAWWLWPMGVLLLIYLGPTGVHSFREFLAGWALNAIPLGVGILIVAYFCRSNVLAYVGAIFGLQVAGPVVDLFSQPSTFFRWNGVALLVLTLLTIIWMGGSAKTPARAGMPGAPVA